MNGAAHYYLAPFYRLVALTTISFLISFFVSPLIAWAKGYSPIYWPLSMGPIGLLVIILLPSLKTTAMEKIKQSWWSRRADTIGMMLTIAFVLHSLFFAVAYFIPMPNASS